MLGPRKVSVFVIARVRNSESLLQSNVCNFRRGSYHLIYHMVGWYTVENSPSIDHWNQIKYLLGSSLSKKSFVGFNGHGTKDFSYLIGAGFNEPKTGR